MRSEPLPRARGDLFGAIFSRHVGVRLECHIVAEQVFGRVFEACQQTIIVRSVHIEPLMPADFARLGQLAHPSALKLSRLFVSMSEFG